MKGRFALPVAAWLLGGCGTMGASLDMSEAEFPPPVIAGVTKFAQVVPPEPTPPDTSVPPAVVWGVTKFPETVVDAGVPDSAIDKPVVWVRFGVTKEAAERETALARSAPPQGKGS